MNKVVTDFLTPRSSYLVGVGTLMNLAGGYFLYNNSPTPAQADGRAIFSDWTIVGQDLVDALKTEKKKALNPPGQLELSL